MYRVSKRRIGFTYLQIFFPTISTIFVGLWTVNSKKSGGGHRFKIIKNHDVDGLIKQRYLLINDQK